MSDCRICARWEECLDEEDCGLFVKKRMTNADRIRVMTDEELAEQLARLETKCYLRFLPHWKCNTENFAKDWLDWLKQEVDDA